MSLSTSHCILASAYSKDFNRDGRSNSANVDYLCDWTDHDALTRELLGYVNPASGSQSRQPPHQHPIIPYLFATKVRVEGIAITGVDAYGHPTYRKARVSATYTVPPATEKDNPDPGIVVLTEQWDFMAEYRTIPGRELVWDGGPDDINGHNISDDDYTAGVRCPMQRIVFDIQYWIDPPFSTFDDTVGKVNSVAITPTTREYAAETLLFEGASASRQFTLDGNGLQVSAWRVGLNFSWKPNTWNKMLAKDAKWYNVINDEADPLYAKTPFASILPG